MLLLFLVADAPPPDPLAVTVTIATVMTTSTYS